GDFSVRLPVVDNLQMGEVSLAFNALAEHNGALVQELQRLSRVVRENGTLNDRAFVGQSAGGWNAALEAVNSLLETMAYPTVQATAVLTQVAEGDLSPE